jgi:transglutaminase-like putative cysteine protease
MLRNSQGFTNSQGFELTSPEALTMWMRATKQLDITAAPVRVLANKLTRVHRDERAKAVAIHTYVKTLPFGVVADFLNNKASDIAKLGFGDCHAKGVLFVALLRASSVPARLRFVTLPTLFLSGLIDTGTPTMTHAVAEVYLEGSWLQNDTYVVDAALDRKARELLQSKQMQLGFGVHAMGDQGWTGRNHAHAQYHSADPSSLPVVDWGVAHDPAHFYADESHAALRHTFMVRVKWMLGAQIVNRKVEQIRQRGRDFSNSLISKASQF